MMMSMRSSPIEIFAHTVKPCPEHCRSTGNWLFCNRRWLSPSHPPDRARLDAGYDALCAAFPAFAACPRHRFLARLAHVSESWSAARNRAPGPTCGRSGLADTIDWAPAAAEGGYAGGYLSGQRRQHAAPAGRSGDTAAHDTPAGGLGSGDAAAHDGGGEPRPSPAAAAIRVHRLLNPSRVPP